MPPAFDDRQQELRRNRRVAASLLLLALLVFVAGVLLQARGHAWGVWLRVFGEAAAVGGLADWFAVVALFRHPLGQRWIPHTAILPRNKARIADNLAAFVRERFLEPQALLQRLRVFEPAGRLAQWLGDARRVDEFVHRARAFGLRALDWLDDARLQRAFRRLLVDALQRWDAAQTAGQVLDLLTRDGRHQELLDEALARLGDFLAQDDVRRKVSALLVRHARREWPAVITVVDKIRSVDSMGDYLADKLAQALIGELRAILEQPDHPVRLGFDDKAREFIERLRADPALRRQVHEIKARFLEHPGVQSYVDGLVLEVREWLRGDLARDDSRLGAHLRDALAGLGRTLAGDAELRASIDDHVLGAAGNLVLGLRDTLSAHIAQTVKSWDDATMVRELELSVGKDLQHIRLNGTLVGGLAGLALHAAAVLLPLLAFP